VRIIQVLNALDFGDGVSNDIINKYHLLKDLGYETAIYSKWVDDNCVDYYNYIENLKTSPDDIIIHHYSGRSHVSEVIAENRCIKVLIYHNITPPDFFAPDSVSYTECIEGLKEIKKISEQYDFFAGVSQFNIENLMQLGINGKMDVLPILVGFEKLKPYKQKRIEREKTEKVNFLFVGRIAPNKKQEDVIDIFNYYYCNINANCKLTFVGNYSWQEQYYNAIKEHLSSLRCCNNVEFTGKVSDEELYNYYADADIYVCMSEHEGFCIPLLESMYCGIPTIAYDSCAVKSTMGGAGVLISNKQPEKIAKLCHAILTRKELYNSITEKQKLWTDTFSKDKMGEKLISLIKKWSKGNINE